MAEQIEKTLAEMGLEEGAAVDLIKSLKADLDKHRTRKNELDEATNRLKDYEAKAEADRLAKLSEAEQIREKLAEKEREIVALKEAQTKTEKSKVLTEVLFDALKDKSLTKMRKELYTAKAQLNPWNTAEELKAILNSVDAEIDDEVKNTIKNPTLPGDRTPTGSSDGKGMVDELNRMMNSGPKLLGSKPTER
jgi:hypothetical protein